MAWRFLGLLFVSRHVARRRRRARVERREELRRHASEIALQRANAHLQASLGDVEILDLKAVHLAVADIAVFAIVITFHSSWLWLIPAAPLAAGAVAFLLAFQPATWELGPEPDDFFREERKKAQTRVNLSMLAQVMWAADYNKARLRPRSACLVWGYRFLALGLISTFAIAVIDRIME